MEVDEMISNLNEKYENVYSITLDEKYFHPKTVRNFIDALPTIRNNNYRLIAYESLDKFLDECEQYLYSMDRKISASLWRKYLRTIAGYYRDDAAFAYHPSFPGVFILFIPVFFIVKLFFFTWTIAIIFALLCYLVTVVYLNSKRKTNKSFGIFH